MTEERQKSNSISVIHSMLNRLKSTEMLQGSSHVTERNPSECLIKPETQNDVDVHSEYFTQRTNPTTNTFLRSGSLSNLLHNLLVCAREDSQPESTKVDSNPKLVKGTTVPIKYKNNSATWTENTVTSVEESEHPPLHPLDAWKDFKLVLEPINLLEEICSGDKWAKFLPVKESTPKKDSKDYLQTEDTHPSNNDMRSVMKPDLSSDKKPSDSSSSPPKMIDNQMDKSSDSPIFAILKQSSIETLPDLSVVQSSGVLDNSVQKSKIQLSKNRNHRPPVKRKKENTTLGFPHQRSASTDFFQSPMSSHASSDASSKFYTTTCVKAQDSRTHEDSHSNVLGNEKAFLQRRSERSVLYINNQISYKSMEEPLEFSVVTSSGVLDNSSLKNRIQLNKKRKHRPPGRRNHEIPKMKFPTINLICQSNTSKEPIQPHSSSYPSVSTSSSLHNLLRCYHSKDSQTPVPDNQLQQKSNDRLLKPKLWKIKR